MARAPERMNVPKQLWVTRRTEGYDDWGFSFFKDLFQNATDAGAKSVDIRLEDAAGQGAFGRAPALDRVVRVTFADDGHGMDEATLRNVFLSPGESTKKGGDLEGGYGTARIMLCFSQVRYAVQTGDLVVEGDGTEYTCQRRGEAIEGLREDIALAVAEGREEAGRLQADLARLEASPEQVKGCRFEIDINPEETPYSWRNMSRETLQEKLARYLSMSQLPCRVTLNGEEVTTRALRGPAKRVLTAKLDGGEELDFATIHTSLGERAQHKGRLVVRSHGAAMFDEPSGTREQVIVELYPAVAKLAMTENRGGLKRPFREAVQNFLRELTLDSASALKDKDKIQHIEIRGGLGALVARPPGAAPLPDVGDTGELVLAAPKPAKARLATPEEHRIEGFEGVPRASVEHLIQAIAAEQPTFLERAAEATGRRDEAAAVVAAVRAGDGMEALRLAGPELAGAIAATLLTRGDAAQLAERQAEQNRYANMNDVHIRVEDVGQGEAAEKLRNAVRRHKPGYWRREGEHLAGRGMQAHMLLAAWTACCQEAVNTLLTIRPDAARDGELRFATGFYFEAAKERWNGRDYAMTRTDAVHQERDGLHALLVNPVLMDNATPAYDLTKARGEPGGGPGGIQDLEAIAIHEVAHILEPGHDADFANLMTKVAALFDRSRAHAKMREAVDAVRAVYGKGRSRIQAMDGEALAPVLEAEPEEAAAVPTRGRPRAARPAEVVLAHAAPVATMVLGAVSARENEHLEADGLKQLAGGALTPVADGVMEVDCDRLQGLEQRLGTLDPAALAAAAAEAAPAPAAPVPALPEPATAVTAALDSLDLGPLLPPAANPAAPQPLPAAAPPGLATSPAAGGLNLDALDIPAAASQGWAPSVTPPAPAAGGSAAGLDLGALNLQTPAPSPRAAVPRQPRTADGAEGPRPAPAARQAAAPDTSDQAAVMAALGSLSGALAAISTAAMPPAVPTPAAMGPKPEPVPSRPAPLPGIDDVERRAAALIEAEFDFNPDAQDEPEAPTMGMR